MLLLLLLLQTIWLGLPGAISNMAPPIAAKLFPNFLKSPIDMSKSFRGKRLFGDNKTIRGLFIGILLGEVAFLIQQMLAGYAFFVSLNIIAYNSLPWYFGFLFGIGALGGDLIKSFAKRQFGIPAGHTWIPFDQIDWIIGLLVVLLIFVKLPLSIIITGLTLGLILHIVVKFTGFLLGLDKKPI
ncbi:MAG TPA: CDP-archaeol synthase [Patescibacteria group bacterium]